jgi:hypothetical protein
MDGFDLAQIAVLAFATGLGTSFGAEFSKYLITKMKENALVKKLKEGKIQ